MEQEVRGSIPGFAATILEIGYLLLPSRDMAEISPNLQYNQPTIRQIFLLSAYKYHFYLFAKLFTKFSKFTRSEERQHPNPTKAIKETRAQRGTDRSPVYNEHFCYKLDSRVRNLTTEWNQKQQHFITHASRSLL